MGAPKNRGYKRSWKNYLLNARYQLMFTLTMVAICGLLIAGVGWFVMRAADKATTVSMDNVLGVACQKPDMSALATTPDVEVVTDEATIDQEEAAAEEALNRDAEGEGAEGEGEGDEGEAGAEGEAAAEGDASADEAKAETDTAAGADEAEPPADKPAAPAVVVDIVEQAPPPPVGAIARYHMCRAQQASTIERLRTNRDRILNVLIGAGVLLCIGLAFYGIKMTHKVAGPLHKVGLYFAKMRDGKYDTVYSLRKGDQLVEFYSHFKEAHEGMRKVEAEDVETLRELIATADAAKLGDQSDEARAALDELREVLKRKEDAIG